MDDAEINCQIPQTLTPGSSANVFYYDTLIRLAQLSSQAYHKIFSYQALQNISQALVGEITSLDAQLESLKRSKEHVFRLDAPIDPNELPTCLSLHRAIYLQYAYYVTLLDIHTILAIPWSQNILVSMHEPSLAVQRERSTQKVARTCRDIILTTTHMNFDASTPHP